MGPKVCESEVIQLLHVILIKLYKELYRILRQIYESVVIFNSLLVYYKLIVHQLFI